MATNYIIEKVTDSNGGSDRIASTFYGTCSTAAGTAQKAVTISDGCTFNDNYLITGVTVHVKFTYSNTHATPTLKVGTATAKQIMAYGTTKSGTTATTSWYAGAVVSFTYDGTYWIQNDYKFDTATESKTAASGGTVLSLVTTGEKYTWNNKGSGTVTSVTLNATSPIAIDSTSAITTSGTRTLSHANSGVTAGTYRNVTVNATGHVTTGSNDISDGTIDQSGFSKHLWTGGDPTVHTVLVTLENEMVSGVWTKFGVDSEISLSNVYVTGLAYSSKYVEGSIYLSEKIDSAVTLGNCTLSGGKVAMYGANGQIYASSATYPSYSITGVRDAGVLTIKFTLSSNFSTNNNNKPAIIWFDSGAKLTLH